MDRVFVHVASEQAIAAAVARARAHVAPGKMLPEIAMVVRGDRVTDQLNFPLLGIMRGVATPRDPTTFKTSWELPLRLTVQVIENDPDKGFMLAEELVGRALHALFTDPLNPNPLSPEAMTQDLGSGAEAVHGIKPGAVEPPMGSSQEADLYQARATAIALLRTTF